MPALLALSDADNPYLLFLAIGGVVALASFVNSVLGSFQTWQNLRNNKGEEVATRKDLREVHARVDAITLSVSSEIGKMRGEIVATLNEHQRNSEKQRTMISTELAGIQRSLGQHDTLKHLLDDHGEQIRDLQQRGTKPR